MAVDQYGTKGQPHFLDAGAPAIAVDPSAVADYAALVGNRIIGSTSDRTANVVPGTATAVWDGLRWFDTGDRYEYMRKGSAWLGGVVTLTLSGTYTAAASPNTALVYCDTGAVVMEGMVANTGTLNATAGQRYVLGSLPTAYAPARNLRFAVLSTTLPAIVEVTTAGEVAYYLSSTVSTTTAAAWNLSLSGARWKLQ